MSAFIENILRKGPYLPEYTTMNKSLLGALEIPELNRLIGDGLSNVKR